MKFKTIYIYAGLVVIAVLFLIFSTHSNEKNVSTAGSINNNEMPQDSIHSSLMPPGKETPSKSNVSPTIMQHMEQLKKAMEESPKDTAKIREYADFLLAAHQTDNALKLYKRLVKLNYNNTYAHFSLAFIYYNKRELDKAEKENDIILSYDKNNPQALYNKGAIIATRGDKVKAKEILQKVVALYPSSQAAQLAKAALQRL